MPGPSHHSQRTTQMLLGRGLIAIDGIVVLALACSILIGTAWQESFGAFASMSAALPMAAWAVGLILCQTDAELVVAAPTVITFYIGACLKGAYLNGPLTASAPAVVAVLHLAPYLPIQAEVNPFYMALVRVWKTVVDYLSNPISGFGDG